MKSLALILVLASLVVADHHFELGKKQQDVNRLLLKVHEPLRAEFADLFKAAASYQPEDHADAFTDGGSAAKRLGQEITDKRVLQRHHWFSLFNDRHREEALMLFEVLMNAKTWEAFSGAAAHYRELMNEGVFVYGLYVGVIHSPLGKGVVLPPLYEVTPHMFTNSEVVQQAYAAKMKQTPGKFRMSFTGTKKNPEQRVAYFGEDIGLNVHHVTWHMDYPFWWKDTYGYELDRKGELFFWVHHQLTARFDAERLSNHLEPVEALFWDRPIKDGFAPHTTYKFGGEFPFRPDNVDFQDVDGVARIRDMMIYEERIRDAIAHGYITARDGSKIDIRNENGINILGDVIESSEYSPNTGYYGAIHNLAHMMLGRQGDPHGKFAQPPGVMEHFETATRDPSFFRLHKTIDQAFKEHKDSLTPYDSSDLGFEPIALNSFRVSSSLVTFFEDFEFSLENGVDDGEVIKETGLSAIVSRLNYKPFHIDFDLTNSHNHDEFATIRVYLCPRRDANGIIYPIDEGRWGCIEMDKFWRTLTPGVNQIRRESIDSSTTVPDVPSFKTLIKEADCAVGTGSHLDLSKYSRGCGIPNRLLLPKGSSEGTEFALVVAVTDGKKDAAVDGLDKDERGGSHSQCGIRGEVFPDKRPLGFPLDRRIPDERTILSYPNIKHQIVELKHID